MDISYIASSVGFTGAYGTDFYEHFTAVLLLRKAIITLNFINNLVMPASSNFINPRRACVQRGLL